VKAANRAGGEDNITVVLFKVEGAPAELDDTAIAGPNGRGEEADLEDTLSGLEAPTLRAATPAAVLDREAEEERTEEWGPPVDQSEPEPKRRSERHWGRKALWALLGITFVLALIAAAFWALSRANFIGADEDGNVVVYQGVPYRLGGGVDLFRARYVSRLKAIQLTEAERKVLFNHSLVSYDDARDRIAPYEAEGVP
jgi:protein phosphatase